METNDLTVPAPGNGAAPPRKYKHLTPKEEREILVLHARGTPNTQIATQYGCHTDTIARVIHHPTNRTVRETLVKDFGVQRRELREEQKQIIMEKARALTAETWLMVGELVRKRDPKGFALAMQGMEKLNRVSGDSVGEGQRVEVTGPPAVDLRVLITHLLEEAP